MVELVRRLALPIAVVSLAVNAVILIFSVVLWVLAIYYGWISSIEFVSHVSMLALVFAGVSGVAAGLAGILALVPTDDVLSSPEGESTT
jgi:hypothetical protein